MVYCSALLRGELWLAEDEVLGGNLSFLLGSPNSDEDRARYDQGASFPGSFASGAVIAARACRGA